MRRLRVSHAFHSGLMEPMLDDFRHVLEQVEFGAPTIPLVSNLTGAVIPAHEVGTAEYWTRHARETVRFMDGVRHLRDAGVTAFLEVGPDGVLTAMAQDCLEQGQDADTGARAGAAAIDGAGAPGAETEGGRDTRSRAAGRAPLVVAAAPRNRAEPAAVLTAAAALFTRGVPVDWRRTLGDTSGRRIVELPTYAFQRSRYWLDDPGGHISATALGLEPADHPLFGAATTLPDDGGTDATGLLLTGRLSLTTHPWLAEHTVHDTALFPGTAFVELALRAGRTVGCDTLDELVVGEPLALPETGGVRMQVSLGAPDPAGRRTLTVHTRGADEDGPWTRHATAILSTAGTPHDAPGVPPKNATDEDVTDENASGEGATREDAAAWPPPGAEPVDIDDPYADLAERGFRYGPLFQGLRAVWRRGGDLFAEVALPEERRRDAAEFGLHPALLDAALHAAAHGGPTGLPFAWNGVRLHTHGAGTLRVRLTPTGDNTVALAATDDLGRPVVTVESLTVRPLEPGQLARTAPLPLHRVDWVTAPVTPPEGGALAVLGDDPFGLGLKPLTDLAADQDTLPAVLVLPVAEGDAPDPATAAHRAVLRTLGLLRAWLADPRWESARLLVLVGGGLAAAAVSGLVRSAQNEHPARITLVEAEGTPPTEEALRLTLASGEPRVALRDGRLTVPRLVRTAPPRRDTDDTATGRLSGSVLVTGATGALGGIVARHLAERGAAHLVLAGRRGAAAEGATELETALVARGARVTWAACDAADRDRLDELIQGIEPPLTGVVHAAGALADGTLASLTPDQVASVLRPKVDAAWHLHELTRELDLAFFALYSSAAGVFGNPGQGNYAAANAFLDALAEHRRALGLPAVSLAWGLWEGGGMADRADRGRLARGGLLPLGAADGMALFDAALTADEPLLVPARFAPAALGDAAHVPPLLRSLAPARARRAAPASDGRPTLRAALRLPAPRRDDAVLDLVRAEVAAVLGHTGTAGVDAERPLSELGLDSLAAVELRNRLAESSGRRLPPTLALDHPTPAAIAAHLAQDTAHRPDATEPAAQPLTDLYRRVCAAGHTVEATRMIITASLARPAFAPGAVGQHALPPVPLTPRRSTGDDGPAPLTVVCLPTVSPVSGPHEYARLAGALGDDLPVLSLRHPGFRDRELVPDTLATLVAAHAHTVLDTVGRAPFALLGHSMGGLVAHAVAEELQRRGATPAGLVMIDTYHLRPDGLDRDWLMALPAHGTRQDEAGAGVPTAPAGDTGLTAMGAYMRLFDGWEPTTTAAPTLLLRADRPTPAMRAAETGDGWRVAWPLPHEETEAPGDHFGLLDAHAATTAAAVRDWLRRPR
ncbi:SDR family NAD(P)-dependent oxidoreductase [Streptomyces sp. NPDC050560]|uniref:SDR family NAD(P)-dependent oxidoreductase n=1 Tax=Streptomyces sp. NPDC050560 TaxID=3365630 RepID=UPI0037ADFE64